VAGVVAALLLAVARMPAQGVTAAVNGVVTDTSGSAIPNATVTATDVQRGTTYKATTNSQGFYNLAALPIGTYTLRTEAKGFKTAQHPAFVLQLNQVANVDVKLEVGAVEQMVTVTEAAPLLQTETTQTSTVIDEKTNKDLPLATRNYVQLTLLAPGATNPNPQSLTTVQTPASAGRPYINGNREQENNFILDGMDNNQVSDNLVGYNPSVDAIEEFSEITQNASAEYGNSMGGIITTAIKSGTNSFHGDLFEFVRNDKFNANTWSNNFNSTANPRPTLRWNMFGGTFGGPIEKDKLFFFGDYQAQRYDIPASSSFAGVWDPTMRAGNFGILCPGGFDTGGNCTSGTQLKDPKTGAAIPYNDLAKAGYKEDSAASYLLGDTKDYPLPNYAQGSLANGNNFTFFNRNQVNGDQGDLKLDYAQNDANKYFVRFSTEYLNAPSINTGYNLSPNGVNNTWARNGVADWTHIFSPTVINDARLGANYVKLFTGADWNVGNLATAAGIAGANPVPGLPCLGMGGGGLTTGIGCGGPSGGTGNGVTQLFASTVIQAEDAMTITSGKHVLRTGMQFYRNRIDIYYSGNPGQLGYIDYTGAFTGAGVADFWLGIPHDAGRGGINGTWGQRASEYAGYLQDDWNIASNLTLNLGLRYDNHRPWYEVRDRQVNFDLVTGQPVHPTPGNRALYNSYNLGWDFQPRMGFAWSPAALGKDTVVRGAWTVSSYLEGTGTNLRLPQNPPFTAAFGEAFAGGTTTENALLGAGQATVGADPYKNGDLRVWDPNTMPAIANQYALSIQRQFGTHNTAQIGYVGQKNTHLMVPMNYAQFRLSPSGLALPGLYLGEDNPNGIFQVPNAAGTGAATTNDGAFARGTASIGNQRYDSLQAVFQHRFDSNLTAQLSYTYSKCMTDSSGYYGSWGGETIPTNAYFQDLYNQRAEWGPCYYDTTHILTGYGIYNLPFGRGRAIGHDWNGVTNTLLGGWEISSILTMHTGYALTTFTWAGSNAYGNSPLGTQRANCNGPVQYVNQPATSGPGIQWFNQGTSFSVPSPTQFGSCSVGDLRGPGMFDTDMSMQKHFVFAEGKDLEFRAEAINFTNTPTLNTPNTTVGQGMGVITSAQNPRQVQFALKLSF
jgi:hypothetical protein